MTLTPAERQEDSPGHAPGRYLPDNTAPEWVEAFTALPRSLFLPELIWAWDMDSGTSVAIDRRTDPDAWLAAAASDIPIVTQWDDGAHDGIEAGRVSTSSASMPSVVARMVAALDAHRGHTALNLGVGTGWDTALLVHELGDAAVTALDVDASVTTKARTRLAAAGYHPSAGSATERPPGPGAGSPCSSPVPPGIQAVVV
ncbi:protein-L-isoaspartate O-methyltransferase family protein [Streptacidiphilus anmyonensis]|uniref:protein-L-isoaspartate O-methyltransferase family protein n=1 Tax=Streptacidiphilus anmyonensis TaxID=405782 RepID=UPI0006934712|nr:hypothetical protein [Streptacidiphilus anmyonensis]